MKTLHLDSHELDIDFNSALKLVVPIAQQQLGDDTMLSSWYDRERDLESPAGVSECHEGCATKGSSDYALNRGAARRSVRLRPLLLQFPLSVKADQAQPSPLLVR